jgi:hypothetical protein
LLRPFVQRLAGRKHPGAAAGTTRRLPLVRCPASRPKHILPLFYRCAQTLWRSEIHLFSAAQGIVRTKAMSAFISLAFILVGHSMMAETRLRSARSPDCELMRLPRRRHHARLAHSRLACRVLPCTPPGRTYRNHPGCFRGVHDVQVGSVVCREFAWAVESPKPERPTSTVRTQNPHAPNPLNNPVDFGTRCAVRSAPSVVPGIFPSASLSRTSRQLPSIHTGPYTGPNLKEIT